MRKNKPASHSSEKPILGAQSGNRTRTILLSQDFESSASTNSAIRANGVFGKTGLQI